ncbi:MAG: hypothetical protein O9333_01550 [Beijerinckiaceae bacterium]|nr:hypothetical protein [Beijerinckiaceae bacterium]
MNRPLLRLVLLVPAMAGLLAACATDGTPPAPVAAAPAAAEARDKPAETALANRLRVTTPVTDPAGFVRESRPAQQEYIPVGVTPQRSGVQRSATELQSIEKELDAQRQRSRAFANRPKPPSPYDGRVPPRLRPAAPAQPE